ncbi:MAG: hypothetical protein M1821_006923 [Bathelium mastoideum]|nr:MAG: hypothetical protein M1821_006923 [Bathelium mastoideum]
MQPNAAPTANRNGNDRPLLSVPVPYRPQTAVAQTPPTPPHNHDPFSLSAETFFNKQNAAALLCAVIGPATPPQSDCPFQSRMAQPPHQQPNRNQSQTPPLPWQRIPAEYRPAYWNESDVSLPHPQQHHLHTSTSWPLASSSSPPRSAPRQGENPVPRVNEPSNPQPAQSLSAFQLQQQQLQQSPQLHLLNPHYASLSDVKRPLSIQSRRPRRLRSMLRLAPDPESDLRTRIVHPHFDPNAPVQIIPPRSAPPQLSAAPDPTLRSASSPGTPSSSSLSLAARHRAASGAERIDPTRISPAQPPVRASSMRERGWDEGWEVHQQGQQERVVSGVMVARGSRYYAAEEDVEMAEEPEEEYDDDDDEDEEEPEERDEEDDEDEDAFELALFAQATSGMCPPGVGEWSAAAAEGSSSAGVSPSQARHARRRSSRQPVSPISPPTESGRSEYGFEREAARQQGGGREHRERESRHRRNMSNVSRSPSAVSGIVPSRRSWETFLEPEPNFGNSGPGRDALMPADELPSYGQSQLEASQRTRQEAARRAAELQRRWEESYRPRR